jgi:eukaryotic-like serine/threonine-protein kinase
MRAFLLKLWHIPFVYALIFWGVLIGIVGVSFDSILMPVVAGRWAFTESVPAVLGKPSAEAEQLLRDADLQFRWSPEGRYSTTVPAGHVLIQIPEPGRVVKLGRTVQLTVSKGQREVEIPDLRGKSQRQAEITLQRTGLEQGKTIEGAHAKIPRGVVIRTEPAAGKVVRMGQKVDLVISSGKSSGKTMLPNLIEFSMEKAFQTLDSLQLAVGTVHRKTDSGKLPNTVLDQSPRSGEYLDPGTKVDLTVAD